MPLRCAILAAICAVDFAAMFKDMSITAGDLATKSYKSRKFFEFMESPWLSITSRQTIKQSVSMFLHGPQSTSAFWLIMNFDPFFLLYGETVALFRFFRFGDFPGSARAWTMFPQLKHLQTSVHPMPPATHGHFDLRRLSWHDLWLAFGSPSPLLFCPTPHLQPLFRLFFTFTTSLELHVFLQL